MFNATIAFAVVASLTATIAFSAQAQDSGIRPVPIVVGGDPDMPACGSVGVVKGLDPKGDGFLAVKTAPSLKAPRIDKLTNGIAAYVCQEDGDWYGIIYSHSTKQNCNLDKPRRRGPYKGPCRSGWAHKRWIDPFVG